MIQTYDKLVRDRVPELIRQSGATPHVLKLNREEYRKRLRQKLEEELREYLESGRAEELADLYEVMRACAAEDGKTWDDIEELRRQKARQRGGFSQQLLLMSVEDHT